MKHSHNWHGGRTVTSHGYVRIYCPAHPQADSKGYVYEHRLVAEKILGRYLSHDELVHHVNGNRQDNSPANLLVTNGVAGHKAEHRHRIDTKKPEEPNPFILCGCGCGQSFLKYDTSNRPRNYIPGHARKGKYKHDRTLFVACACGCGTSMTRYDKYGRERKFITGHNTFLHNPNPHVK